MQDNSSSQAGSDAPRGTEQPLLSTVSAQTGVATEELQSMLEAISRGEDLSSYFGLTAETLASFESVAVSYYSGKLYDKAAPIFTLLLLLTHNQRGSAWRGLAACRQATLDYRGAIEAYTQAITLDPQDFLSGTYLAECLLLTGEREVAAGLLHAILSDADPAQQQLPHLRRARALKKSVEQAADTSGAPLAPMAAPAATPQGEPHGASGVEAGSLRVPAPIPADPEIRAFMQQPGVSEQLEELSRLFHNGALTLRDIADFSQEQMDAGYAVCCTLLEQQDFARCLEMSGWMLFIDSHDARFYQLSGLSAMGLELYCLAEHLFNMDGIWREGGPDAATLIYKGEALVRQNEVDEGLQAVASGIALAANRREYHEVVARGLLLQKVYAVAS